LLGIAGSLRRRSFNAALLRAAGELLPEGMTLETHDLHAIPLYDGDVEAAGLPAPVVAFRDRIAAANAVLIVTPEDNHSIPGVLTNAIDWASRAPTPPLAGKPVAMMGTSPAIAGSLRAQMHLREVLATTGMLALGKPEVYVPRATEKLDADLRLVDEPTRKQVKELLEALAAWTRRLRG